jgi:hypothetical protein
MALYQDMLNTLQPASPLAKQKRKPGELYNPPLAPSPYATVAQETLMPAAQQPQTQPQVQPTAQPQAQPQVQPQTQAPPPPPANYFAPVSFTSAIAGPGEPEVPTEGEGGTEILIPDRIGEPYLPPEDTWNQPDVKLPDTIGDPIAFPEEPRPEYPVTDGGGGGGTEDETGFDLRQWIEDWFRSQIGGEQFEYRPGGESRWDSELARQLYESQSALLGEDYDELRRQQEERANTRGMYYSTPNLGRLGDIDVQQSRALRDLSLGIQREAANTYAQDVESAYGRQAGTWQMNEGLRQAQVQERLARLAALMGFDQQSFQQQLDLYGMNNDQFQQWLEQMMTILGTT